MPKGQNCSSDIMRKDFQADDTRVHEPNLCPICGSQELEYGLELWDKVASFYPWRCKTCGAQGTEQYKLEFQKHCDIRKGA